MGICCVYSLVDTDKCEAGVLPSTCVIQDHGKLLCKMEIVYVYNGEIVTGLAN